MAASHQRHTDKTDLGGRRSSRGSGNQDHPGEHLQGFLDSLRDDDWRSQEGAQQESMSPLRRLLASQMSR